MKEQFAKTVLIFALFLGLLLPQTVTASSIWTWEKYVGTTQWNVAVIDNQLGCGGGIIRKNIKTTMDHDGETVRITDLGHGPVAGTINGNKLRIPSKKIKDGAGYSTLSVYEITFSPDCLSFTGAYTWDYIDSMMGCSGDNKISGTRTDATGCPSIKTQHEQIAEARADQANQEAMYKKILAEDPNSFWANWDMAELKKKQGKYDEYLDYVEKSATNKKIDPKTREALKNEAAKSLHLSKFPEKGTSRLLKYEMDEISSWNEGIIYKTNFKPANKEKWKIDFWRIIDKGSDDLVNKVVFDTES